MTITRADVEWALANPWRIQSEGFIAELARTWLAVDDAPTGETFAHGFEHVSFDTTTYIPAGTYKLVCIDTPTGGREGL